MLINCLGQSTPAANKWRQWNDRRREFDRRWIEGWGEIRAMKKRSRMDGRMINWFLKFYIRFFIEIISPNIFIFKCLNKKLLMNSISNCTKPSTPSPLMTKIPALNFLGCCPTKNKISLYIKFFWRKIWFFCVVVSRHAHQNVVPCLFANIFTSELAI